MSTTPQTAAVLPPEQHGYIPDKLKKAEKRIAQIAHDTEAWSVLIRDAQMRKIEEARQVYERLVAQFPNAGKYWRIYIEQELKCKNFERVEKLFQRCLVKVLSIDLWKLYLSYIKDTKDNLPSYREKMAQAYDFALDKMGMDIMSYNLWVDYINFLKAVEAVGSYAENQRITAVRKVYQRGVVNPMINIEALWKDYCAYETNINPLIAKKMTEDRGRDYMNARRVAKEYEAVTRGLNKNLPSVPPQNSPEEAQQVDLWKKYISWEKSNPLRTEDHALITKRVMFAYEQCLLCLGHHPDIWYEAASYLEQSSKILTEKGDQNAGKMFADEAAAVYERAITTLMKNNMLVYFAYADFEEGRMKYEKVHNIYKRLLAVTDIDPTLGYVQYMKFARRAEGIKSARLVFKMAREDNRTRFQVFVAASLMEYYCSKEKTVALKIFELGLKKYGGIPEYVLCYMEFMSHLNEDNNTRVLYERVLSSGQIQPEKSIEIWSRFLAFESEVGDLASIQKVEKRRTQAIEKVQEFEGKDTALLIDRYKYLDLYPCSQSELKALGYYDLAKQRVVQLPGSEVTKVVYDEEEGKKAPEYPKPDIEQMLPFKPRQNTPNGSHPVPGGVFPPPPAAANLLTLIPPPDCFHGPFVVMDKFIEQMKNLVVPDGSPYDTYPLHVEEIHHGGPEMEEVTNNMQVQDNNILIVSNDVQFFNEKFSKESDRIDLQQNRNGRFYLDSREDTMLGPACKSTDLYVENESIELRENMKKKKRKKKQQMNEMQSKVTSSVSVMKDEDILTDEGTYDTIRKMSANVEDVCSTSSLDSDLTGQDNSDMEQDLKDQSDSERKGPLEKIQRIVWPDKGMECHVPGCITKKYSNIRTYHQKHWKAVHEPLVIARKCPECQQIYKKNTNFKKHMVKIHGKNRRKMKNWVAKCLVKLPNPDYISPGTLLAPVLPRRHDYRKTDNSRRKGDDELVELAFSDTEDDYEEEISDQSNSVNSLKKCSVRCQNNQDFNLERNAGNFCHIQDTEKIQQPDSQNEFHLMTENIDSLNIQTKTAHDTGITEKHRNLQIGHASDSENIVQSNLESHTDEEIVVQSNLETQLDTEYIDQCNLETQPDIKNNDQSKLETQPDPDIEVPSASKQRKIEKVIWPEGGMACHIPACHSEVFYYWKDYMNLHWYKVHKQAYRLYICPKCGYETNNMDELKKHVRIAHKIKKRGEIRQLVDGCRKQVQNKLYIPTNGMYPPVRKQREIMTAGKDDQLECSNTEDVLEDKECLPTSVTMVTDTEIINKKIIEMIDRYIPVGYRGATKGIRKQCPGQSEPQSQMYQDIEKCSHKDIEIQYQLYRAEPPQIQSKVETSTSMAESQMPVHSAETLSKSKVVSVTCKIEPQASGYNMKHSSEITPQRVPCKIEPQSPESSIENPSEFTAGRLTFKDEPQSPEFSIENPSKVTQVCCTENLYEQISERIVFPVEGMSCHVPGCDTVIFKSIGEFMKYHWNLVHKPTIQYATCPICTMIFMAKNPLKSHLVSKHKMKKVDAVQVLDKNLREAPNPIYVSPGGIGPPRMRQPMTVDSKSNTLEVPSIMENGVDGKPDAGTQFSIDIAMGRKRKITEGDESDEESNDVTAPPIHDIYRSRQQKRTK